MGLYLNRDKILEFILDILRSKDKNVRILDVGCGDGYFTNKIYKRGYKNIIGLDKSRHMIIKAKRRNQRIRFISADFIKFKSRRRFDFIICTTDVLNHIPTEKGYVIFKKCFNLLKNGGYLIFDINTEDFLNKIAQKRVAKKVSNEYFLWKTSKIGRKIYIELSTFNGKEQLKESFIQFIYKEKEVEKELKANRFDVIEKTYDYSYNHKGRFTSKVCYIVKKT